MKFLLFVLSISLLVINVFVSGKIEITVELHPNKFSRPSYPQSHQRPPYPGSAPNPNLPYPVRPTPPTIGIFYNRFE